MSAGTGPATAPVTGKARSVLLANAHFKRAFCGQNRQGDLGAQNSVTMIRPCFHKVCIRRVVPPLADALFGPSRLQTRPRRLN